MCLQSGEAVVHYSATPSAMILATLRNPLSLLVTLAQVADEIMILCRMDKRKTRLSTAETLRTIAF